MLFWVVCTAARAYHCWRGPSASWRNATFACSSPDRMRVRERCCGNWQTSGSSSSVICRARNGGALAAADGFALPAIGEGLSMALLRLWPPACRPIITPGCNLPQVAERGAGWLAAPELDSIAAALTRWLAEATRWPAMAAGGRRLAREEFSWSSVEAALTAVYRDLRVRISSAARS